MNTPSVSEITAGSFLSMLKLKPLGSKDHELRMEIVEALSEVDKTKKLAEVSNYDTRHPILIGITLLGSDLAA